MSKKARPRVKDRPDPASAEVPPPPDLRPPLKPQSRLFYSLLAVLAAWVIGLLVMYFTTVYPNRASDEKGQADVIQTPAETVSR